MSKFSTLRQRVITGVLFGAVVIGLLLMGNIGFTIFILIVCAGSLLELSRMHGTNRAEALLFSVVVSIPLILFLLDINQNVVLSSLAAIAMLSTLFFFNKSPGVATGYLKTISLGTILVAVPCIAATEINYGFLNGNELLLAIIGMLWSNDTFAYFIGSKFGKRKLAPTISPKKTWEGTIGGILTTILLTAVVIHFLQIGDPGWIGMAFIVCIFGTAGDLIQSAIKRVAEVKDSGNLLPGHGGIWDRFDSFLGSIAFVLMYLNFIR